MDIALLLSNEGYKYHGAVSDNTELEYSNIKWLDERQKPTWQELLNKWEVVNEKILKLRRKKTILESLDFIDAKSIRPLREGNVERVNELENQAAILRIELNNLGV